MKIPSYIRLTGLLVVILVGCEQHTGANAEQDKRLSDKELRQQVVADTNNKVLKFGFDVRASLQEDAKQYLPFLKYLEKETGYKFKLRFTPKDGRVVTDLGKGVVQLAAIGATSYIQAADKYSVKPLVRGLNKDGSAEYRSYLVVRPDSSIKDITDIYDKRFAFGSRTSTQGHLIPRIILQKQQIQLQDLKSFFYTGSHQKCAEAVISGKADVCGMQDTMADELAARNQIRILYRSEYFPSSGIAVNGNVPKKVQNKVRQALLAFKPKGRDAKGLYHWVKTEMPNGFVKAEDSDYQALRQWMSKLQISHSLFLTGQPGTIL